MQQNSSQVIATPLFYVKNNQLNFYCRVKVLNYILKRDLEVSSNSSADILSDIVLDMNYKYYILINGSMFDVDKVDSQEDSLKYKLSLYYAIDNSPLGLFKSQGTTQNTMSANFPNIQTSLNNSITNIVNAVGTGVLFPFTFITTPAINITLRFFFDDNDEPLKDKALPLSQILNNIRQKGYTYNSELDSVNGKVKITFVQTPTTKSILKLNVNPVVTFKIIGSLQFPVLYRIINKSQNKETWIKVNSNLEIVSYEKTNGIPDSNYANFIATPIFRDSTVEEIATKSADEYTETIADVVAKIKDNVGADNIEVTLLSNHAGIDQFSKYSALLGSQFELYDGDKKYVTTLTSFENDSTIGTFILVFGTARIKLIDQIKKTIKK